MNNNPKLTYLYFSYDDSLAVVHKYYKGGFIALQEHLLELASYNYKDSHFTFSDKPFTGVDARQYVEID